MSPSPYLHQPVLVHEVTRFIVTDQDGVYLDGTVGTGGHSEAILGKLGSRGRLICVDRDSDALSISQERLAPFGTRVTLVKGSYADLEKILIDLGIERVSGVLLDLGMSSFQLEHSGMGFSFSRDEPLDMRMNQDEEVTAEYLVKELPSKVLENILREYGEERKARAIVNAIVREREKRPIVSSGQLAQLIQSVVPRSHRSGAKHPATKSFQALRIAVNKELGHLESFLQKVPELISEKGRLVVLSYHSLEDRMVKQAMIRWERGCECSPDMPTCVCDKVPLFKRLHKKGIKAAQQEIEDNPRARSATLRVAERV